MTTFHLLSTADPALGKFDLDSLSEQTRMELLVESLALRWKEQRYDANDIFREVCEWVGVRCTAEDKVFSVLLDDSDGGTIDFLYLPRQMNDFTLGRCAFEGNLDIRDLPASLKILYIPKNKISGEIDLSALPGEMTNFQCSDNLLTGSCDLEHIPQTLRVLDLAENRLSGSIVLKKLPPRMSEINLEGNQLLGTLDLEHLPRDIFRLNLSSNLFEGQVTIKKYPMLLEFLLLAGNRLSGTAVLASGISTHDCLIEFFNNSIEAVVDEEGCEHPDADEILGEDLFYDDDSDFY